MSYRSKTIKRKALPQEHELHILSNPLASAIFDDYQAPLTAHSLKPNSKWIIVRNNIHKIRSWGGINADSVDPRCRDWYMFFQMRRELRRAQQHIRQIQSQPDFVPVRYFSLPTDESNRRLYNVSHVKSSDAIYYPSFGSDPIVVQSLLYYFSEECVVPYNSIFRSFLSDVCSTINRDRQRLRRVAVFRKVALTIAIIISIILILMFISLIISLFATASNFRYLYNDDPDGGLAWRQPETTLNYL